MVKVEKRHFKRLLSGVNLRAKRNAEGVVERVTKKGIGNCVILDVLDDDLVLAHYGSGVI